MEAGQVVFKAEIGAVTPLACQVQGVWVPPELRGRGHARRGMAAIVAEARRCVAPVVSLYVNDYNAPARAAYRRVGFTESGTFTSVLF
jgi:predicted GNAT family acetyltransferase